MQRKGKRENKKFQNGNLNGIRSYRGNRIFRLKNFENNNKQNKNELKHIELQLYNNSKLIFSHQRKPNYYLCVIFNAKHKIFACIFISPSPAKFLQFCKSGYYAADNFI